MWLLTTEGPYSVIRWHDGRMCVRGRRRVDLDRLRKIIPALGKVEITPGRDYRYRCFCTVDEWAEGMKALAYTIDYGNFKSEVARKRGYKDIYEHACHSIWTVLAKLQPGGPYGTTNRPGFPSIPKGERKIKPAVSRSISSLLPPSPQLSLSQRDRADDVGLRCDECGHLLAPDAAIVDGQTVVCRNVGDCIDRSHGILV